MTAFGMEHRVNKKHATKFTVKRIKRQYHLPAPAFERFDLSKILDTFMANF